MSLKLLRNLLQGVTRFAASRVFDVGLPRGTVGFRVTFPTSSYSLQNHSPPNIKKESGRLPAKACYLPARECIRRLVIGAGLGATAAS